MLCASASTSRAGCGPRVLVLDASTAAAGGGAASLAGSGDAAGGGKRMGCAGAGGAGIWGGCRRSAWRRLGADDFIFGTGAETRALAAAGLGAAGSFSRLAVFAPDFLSLGVGPAPGGCRLARLAADLTAAALAGLDLPRALGWLGVLAITSVSCRVRAGGLVPFWS